MNINTNWVDIEKYQKNFAEIYANHSLDWVDRQKEHPKSFRAVFDLGKFTGIGKKIHDQVITQEIFYQYITEIVKDIPAFSCTISRVVILPDAVAGYGVHLIPDTSTKNILTNLNHAFFTSYLRKHMAHERQYFVASANLHWIRTKEEAVAIASAINKLPIKIKGSIDAITVSSLVGKGQIEVVQTFNLAR